MKTLSLNPAPNPALTHERCQHRTPTGRQCASRILDPESSHCPRHSASQPPDSRNFSALLTENACDFQDPQGINHSLAALYKLLASGRISTRRATGLAYIASLLLRTLPGIREQIIETTDFSQFVPARGRVGCSDDDPPQYPQNPHGPENPQRSKKTTRRLARLGRASRPAPMLPKNLQRQYPSHNTRYLPLPSPRLLKPSPSHHQPRPRIFRACLPCQVYLQSVQPYGPVQSFPDLPSLVFRSSVAPAHHAHGNRVLTPLHPVPYTALMPQTFSSRRHNFDWRGFITPGVKLIVLICSGVFLLQTLANTLLGQFVDRREVLSLICEAV